MRPRKHIRAEEKIAALHYRCTLLEDLLVEAKGEPLLERLPYDDAKQMTAAQVCSLFQWHHEPIPHEAAGPDVHWNLTAVMIKQHREIEKRGAAVRAKVKRLRAKVPPLESAMISEELKPHLGKFPIREKFKWPSRPFPKRQIRGEKHGRKHRGHRAQ